MATGPAKASEKRLDEVLLAMDVVDTLRHREEILRREMDTEGREDELVARLKEIYAAQGMDVPDSTIREGVKAMADNRFAHQPAKPGIMRRLAIFYITRARWWKPVAAGAAAIFASAGIYQITVAGPQAAAARTLEADLSERLPAALMEAHASIFETTEETDARDTADAFLSRGQAALAARDADTARRTVSDLQQVLADLNIRYQVRVVSRPGEFSGVFRESDTAPGAQNYYLIVEAIDPTGTAVAVTVFDEERQARVRVTKWGQRVTQAVFDRVSADKRDDAIIQDAVIGEKSIGALSASYSVDTPGGAITQW